MKSRAMHSNSVEFTCLCGTHKKQQMGQERWLHIWETVLLLQSLGGSKGLATLVSGDPMSSLAFAGTCTHTRACIYTHENCCKPQNRINLVNATLHIFSVFPSLLPTGMFDCKRLHGKKHIFTPIIKFVLKLKIK